MSTGVGKSPEPDARSCVWSIFVFNADTVSGRLQCQWPFRGSGGEGDGDPCQIGVYLGARAWKQVSQTGDLPRCSCKGGKRKKGNEDRLLEHV